MNTKFKNNQIVKLKEGFYRGSFVKLTEHEFDEKKSINKYKGVMQSKAGDRFVDKHPKKESWYEEHKLKKVTKIFGSYI